MFDYLTRLSLEADVGERKAKREARTRAYWLGHHMSRFQSGTSICKTCCKTITIEEGIASGKALEEPCTQQLLEFQSHEKENDSHRHHLLQS